VGNHCILGNTVQLAGHVIIDDFAIFGGACAVQQFSKIGAHAYIGGGSLVRKDVPPFTKAAREPLSYAGINTVGLRRRGYTSEKINEIQEIYRFIFLKGLNNSKAIDLVEKEISASTERDYILDFVRNSERGIMKGYGSND
jgi:UDP-N-acetylglucosamine acyltransferase